MELPVIDFSQLEFREIGAWPKPIRIALIATSGILGIVLVYFLFLSGQLTQLEMIRKQQEDKRKEYKEKYSMAANLDAYKQQMIQIQDAYKIMLKQLPDSSHVPELIDSISRIAANDNLKFESIKPGEPKSVLGFYKELPIEIDVVGSYHSFGKFISDISKLSRIVTLHDFTIKADKGQSGAILSLRIIAKTYWLSEDKEEKEDSKNKTNTNSKSKAATATKDKTNRSAPGAAGRPMGPSSQRPEALGAPSVPGEDMVTPGAER